MYTDTSLGCPCDLGGQWIHQYGSLNPFKALVESEGIPYKKARGGREWHVVDGETTVKVQYSTTTVTLASFAATTLICTCFALHASSTLHPSWRWQGAFAVSC